MMYQSQMLQLSADLGTAYNELVDILNKYSWRLVHLDMQAHIDTVKFEILHHMAYCIVEDV